MGRVSKLQTLIPPMRDLTIPSGRQNPQVCLQRDGISSQCGCLRFEPRGAVFHSPCEMELMSDLLVCIRWRGLGCRCRTMKLTAVVVGCSGAGDGCFEITVIFLPGEACAAATAFTHLPN